MPSLSSAFPARIAPALWRVHHDFRNDSGRQRLLTGLLVRCSLLGALARAALPEKVFTSCLLTMGALCYAVLVGEVTMIVRGNLKYWQQKSEQMATLRAYCVSRAVPMRLQRQVYSWVAAQQEFSAQCEGKPRLLVLPAAPRNQLLLRLHQNIMTSLPLPPSALAALIVRLRPAVCLRGQLLMAEGEVCTRLYFLQRGALRLSSQRSGTASTTLRHNSERFKGAGSVTASGAGGATASGAAGGGPTGRGSGMLKKMCGDGALSAVHSSAAAAATTSVRNRARNCADDRHERRSVYGKALLTFRMLEREGALVGLWSIGSAVGQAREGQAREDQQIPYTVESVRWSQLHFLERAELQEAAQRMSSEERATLTEALSKAHRMHLDSLKVSLDCHAIRSEEATVRGPGEHSTGDGDDGGKSGGPQPSGSGANVAAAAAAAASLLSTQCGSCLATLREMHAATEALPQLVAAMQRGRRASYGDPPSSADIRSFAVHGAPASASDPAAASDPASASDPAAASDPAVTPAAPPAAPPPTPPAASPAAPAAASAPPADRVAEESIEAMSATAMPLAPVAAALAAEAVNAEAQHETTSAEPGAIGSSPRCSEAHQSASEGAVQRRGSRSSRPSRPLSAALRGPGSEWSASPRLSPAAEAEASPLRSPPSHPGDARGVTASADGRAADPTTQALAGEPTRDASARDVPGISTSTSACGSPRQRRLLGRVAPLPPPTRDAPILAEREARATSAGAKPKTPKPPLKTVATV